MAGIRESAAGRFLNYLLEFLGTQWPSLKTNPVFSAMLIGILLGIIVTWFIYWLVQRGKIHGLEAKINGRDAQIKGLEREVSFLERQKADLEIRLKEALEQKPSIALLPTEKPRLQGRWFRECRLACFRVGKDRIGSHPAHGLILRPPVFHQQS